MRKASSRSKIEHPRRSAVVAAVLRLLLTLSGMGCAIVFKEGFVAIVSVLASYLIPVGGYRVLRVQAVALAAMGAYVYTAVSHGSGEVFFIVGAGLCLGAMAQR
ncbi:MAG TPA: hypothetical protein VMF11_14610 [Candidatus Baltobacteraceae bacterium]|nr:hypothetical protein [Candidatus Baltobacteraceae bacterium]